MTMVYRYHGLSLGYQGQQVGQALGLKPYRMLRLDSNLYRAGLGDFAGFQKYCRRTDPLTRYQSLSRWGIPSQSLALIFPQKSHKHRQSGQRSWDLDPREHSYAMTVVLSPRLSTALPATQEAEFNQTGVHVGAWLTMSAIGCNA